MQDVSGGVARVLWSCGVSCRPPVVGWRGCEGESRREKAANFDRPAARNCVRLFPFCWKSGLCPFCYGIVPLLLDDGIVPLLLDDGVMPLLLDDGVMPLLLDDGIMPLLLDDGVIPLLLDDGIMPLLMRYVSGVFLLHLAFLIYFCYSQLKIKICIYQQ